MSNIYLFRMSNNKDEIIEFVIASTSVKKAIVYIKKELKKELIPLKKQARNSLNEELKLINDTIVSCRKRSKKEKDLSILDTLDFNIFGFKDILKVSCNDYLKDKNLFKTKFIETFMNYYNRKDYSFEFNLNNDLFDITNISKISRDAKSKTKLFTYNILLNKK